MQKWQFKLVYLGRLSDSLYFVVPCRLSGIKDRHNLGFLFSFSPREHALPCKINLCCDRGAQLQALDSLQGPPTRTGPSTTYMKSHPSPSAAFRILFIWSPLRWWLQRSIRWRAWGVGEDLGALCFRLLDVVVHHFEVTIPSLHSRNLCAEMARNMGATRGLVYAASGVIDIAAAAKICWMDSARRQGDLGTPCSSLLKVAGNQFELSNSFIFACSDLCAKLIWDAGGTWAPVYVATAVIDIVAVAEICRMDSEAI